MENTKKTAGQPEGKQPTARELTRQMIEAAKLKNGGTLGGNGNVDRRKFRRL